jgi:hypothetical protein
MSESQTRDADASLPAQLMHPDEKEDEELDSKLERKTVNKLDLILVPAMRYAEERCDPSEPYADWYLVFYIC